MKGIKKICIVIIVLCICLSVFAVARMNALKQFDRMRWNEDFKNRKYMIEDLANGYGLIGMSKEEIINLLGVTKGDVTKVTKGDKRGRTFFVTKW